MTCGVRFCRGEYGCGVNNMILSVKLTYSSFYKSIVRLCPRIKDSCGWLLGNGRSLDAWDTRWISPNIRVVDLDLEIPTHLREAKVADLLDINGEWYWDILNHWLLQNIMDRMTGMTSLCTEVGPNAQIVIGDDNNLFLVKNAYKNLVDDGNVSWDGY